jgi:heme exporter protein D
MKELEEIKGNYYNMGNSDARKSDGSKVNFDTSIQRIHQQHLEEEREDKLKFQRTRNDFVFEKKNIDDKLSSLEITIKAKMEQRVDIAAEIQKIDIEGSKTPFKWLNFIFAAAILMILSFSIWAYYSVLIYKLYYSDLMKMIESSLSQSDTVSTIQRIFGGFFDPNAFSQIFHSDFVNLLVIFGLPMGFLGLSLIMHIYITRRNKMSLLMSLLFILLGFTVDFVLALTLFSNMYNLKYHLMMQGFDTPWQFMNIFSSGSFKEFWAILMFGFLMWVVWGFLLSFIQEQLHKISKETRKLLEIIELRNRQDKLQEEITLCRANIDDIVPARNDKERKIADVDLFLQTFIDVNPSNNLNVCVFKNVLFQKILAYQNGWCDFITKGTGTLFDASTKQKMVAEIEQSSSDYIANKII